MLKFLLAWFLLTAVGGYVAYAHAYDDYILFRGYARSTGICSLELTSGHMRATVVVDPKSVSPFVCSDLRNEIAGRFWSLSFQRD